MSLVRAALGPLVRATRRVRDRMLHPWRRRSAIRRLRRHRMPRGVLFVCHGNICRSPYAEGVFRAQLGGTAGAIVDVRSAGFVGEGRPSPRFAIEEAAARRVDLREHRSRSLVSYELNFAEIVVVMDPHQAYALTRSFGVAPQRLLVLGDLDPVAGERVILDPVDQPRSAFAASYDRIDRCVAVLANLVTRDTRA